MMTTDPKILNMLMEKQTNFECETMPISFIKAFQSNDSQLMKFWLENFKLKESTFFLGLFKQEIVRKDEINSDALFKLLEISQASIDDVDGAGKSALMHACRNRDIEVVKWLIDAGANLDLKENAENHSIAFCYSRSTGTSLRPKDHCSSRCK